MVRWGKITIFLLLLIFLTGFAVPTYAQVSEENPAPSESLSLSLSYYRCDDPEKCKCVALTDKQRTDCTECKKWSRRFLSANLSIRSTDSSQQFLEIASKEIYGTDYPRNPDGSAVSTQQFYSSPSNYGWVELGPEDSKEGALALWPTGGGGLVIGKPERHAMVDNGDLRILTSVPGNTVLGVPVGPPHLEAFTFHKFQADITGVKPIYIVPKTLLEKARTAEEVLAKPPA